jgi:NAD(P)-dependent dehydrogenase (short-subunit alcohol dehydrogenase family)
VATRVRISEIWLVVGQQPAMVAESTLARLSAPQRRDLEARLPQGRLIQPAEIAELVCWLASGPAQVLHGSVIDASMGLGVHPGLLTGWAANAADDPVDDPAGVA